MANGERLKITHLPKQPPFEFNIEKVWQSALTRGDRKLLDILKPFLPIKHKEQPAITEVQTPDKNDVANLSREEVEKRMQEFVLKNATQTLTPYRPHGQNDKGKVTGEYPIADIVEKAVQDKNVRIARQKKPKRF